MVWRLKVSCITFDLMDADVFSQNCSCLSKSFHTFHKVLIQDLFFLFCPFEIHCIPKQNTKKTLLDAAECYTNSYFKILNNILYFPAVCERHIVVVLLCCLKDYASYELLSVWCGVWIVTYKTNSIFLGDYYIDPSDRDVPVDPIQVRCNMTSGETCIEASGNTVSLELYTVVIAVVIRPSFSVCPKG